VAIDTEDKRRSVHGYTHTPIYPVADGSVDLQDRPHVGWIYRGLVIASVGAVFRGGAGFAIFRDKRAVVNRGRGWA